jgi:hypothetical protein
MEAFVVLVITLMDESVDQINRPVLVLPVMG